MKTNPYRKVKHRQTVVASELRRPKSRERIVANDGHINANSNKDLVSQIMHLAALAAEGTHIVTENDAVHQAELAKVHREMVTSAFQSKGKQMEVGETLADELYQAGNREGMMRSFLARQDLSDGQIPMARLRMKNVTCVHAVGPTQAELELARDNVFYPNEYYLHARPYVEMKEIRRSNTDILDEKYMEALEAFMVSEDRLFFDMVGRTVGIANNLTTVVGSINPRNLGEFRNQVMRWNIPVAYWVIANDLLTDIGADNGMQQLLDPVSRHEIVLTGTIGTLLGMKVKSDAFRHSEHKVLSQGQMYIIGEAGNLGQYTDRGGIETAPIDQAHTGVPGRGWAMHLTQSMLIANARAVAVGRRI